MRCFGRIHYSHPQECQVWIFFRKYTLVQCMDTVYKTDTVNPLPEHREAGITTAGGRPCHREQQTSFLFQWCQAPCKMQTVFDKLTNSSGQPVIPNAYQWMRLHVMVLSHLFTKSQIQNSNYVSKPYSEPK